MSVKIAIIAVLSFLAVCGLQILFIYLSAARIWEDAKNIRAVSLIFGRGSDGLNADVIEVPKVRGLQHSINQSCIKTFERKSRNSNTHIKGEIAKKFDWRDKHVIRPVMEQGGCNGCWAIGIVETMESIAAIRGIDTALTALSAQQLIDCAKGNTGCNGGDVKKALNFMCKNNYKITTAKEYPNTFKPQRCETVQDGKRKISEYWVEFYWDENEMVRTIYKHGPLVVAVNSVPWTFYTGGVIQNACSSEVEPNHVAQVVGYDMTADPPYYIIRNSWGEDWGSAGYVMLAIGRGLCCINKEVSYFNVV